MKIIRTARGFTLEAGEGELPKVADSFAYALRVPGYKKTDLVQDNPSSGSVLGTDGYESQHFLGCFGPGEVAGHEGGDTPYVFEVHRQDKANEVTSRTISRLNAKGFEPVVC